MRMKKNKPSRKGMMHQLINYKRTLEDLNSVVGHAKLDVNELHPLSQILYFDETFTDYKLLEVNEEILKIIQEGESLVFKGDKSDKAILCTKNATYDIKEAETSNSLLLIPGLKFGQEENGVRTMKNERITEEKMIVGIFKEYFEIKKTKPNFKRLKALLSTRLYEGPELELETEENNAFTTEELFEKVQASEKEIEYALAELDAFQIYGKWRLMSPDYLFRSLSLILNLIEENSWQYDSLPLGPIIETLSSELPRPVLEHILQSFLDSTDQTDGGEELFTLKVNKTCRFIGEYLLRPVGRFNLKDFLLAWQQSVPEGMQTDLNQLEGLALCLKEVKPVSLKYFPEEALPDDIQERLACLFEAKKLWTFEEIKPYVSKLSTEKQSVQSFLTRYTRASHINGTKFYGARHGK